MNPYTTGRVIVPISMPPGLAQLLKAHCDKGTLSKWVCQVIETAIAEKTGLEIIKPCPECQSRISQINKRPSTIKNKMVQCSACNKIMSEYEGKFHKCEGSI